MYHLIPIPIVILAVMVKLIAVRYDLKVFEVISNIVITVGVIFFIYYFADYLGYNLIEIAKIFLGI